MQRRKVLIKQNEFCLTNADECIYVSVNRVNIGSCSDMSPSRRQTIIYESMCQSNTQEQTQILVKFMSRKCVENVCKNVSHHSSGLGLLINIRIGFGKYGGWTQAKP